MARTFAGALLAAWLWTACSPIAAAQQAAASATVSGTVYDPSEAVVAGAQVSLLNHDTNHAVEAVTDGRGHFRLLYVPVGQYRLSVTAPGFVTKYIDLELRVGQAIDVPVMLPAAAASDEVSVALEAPLVDARRTQVSDVVTPRDIDTLPLNGRNYLDLALLIPNVSRTNTRNNERFAETSAVPGTGISVAGQRNIGNSFIVDGLSANDDAADLAGTYFGEEVIREFQVITSGGTAEFGRASAGVINIVTHSGTNETRGRAYAFLRDDALDAPNPLATREDPLSHSQYGVTGGGPVLRDRTFWFANVERTDQEKTGVVTIAPGDAATINAALDRLHYSGPRARSGEFPTGYETVNAFGRVDHRLPGGSSLEARYSFYDVNSRNARSVGGLNDVSRGTSLANRDQAVAVSWLAAPQGTFLNEARGQFMRSRLAAPGNDLVGPAVSVSGVANFGASTSSPTERDLDLLQFADTVTFQAGAHLLKAGADILFNRTTIVFPGATHGVYDFTSLANLQQGTYRLFQQTFGRSSVAQSNPNAGVFVQDEWQLSPAVTLNAGLRYDLQWLPSPIELDANNVSPRLGVAWAADDRRTVVRGSAGVYFDRIPLRATSNALQRDGVSHQTAVIAFGQTGAPMFPRVLDEFPRGLVTAITTMDRNIQNGRSEQFSVQVERALGSVGSLTAGYSRLRGRNIILSRNVNVPTLTAAQAAALGVPNLGRPDPAFANISRYEAAGDSWFNGVTVSLSTRNGLWGNARASYTLSRSEDTSGNAFFSSPQNSFDIAAEKGPSDNDQRHRFTLSGAAGGSDDTLSRALGGFQLGYVLSLASGVPFNPLAGSDVNGDTNNNDRATGMTRNSFRQSATATFDLRVSRPLVLGTHRIELMIEAFNLFNRTNVLAVNNTYGTGDVPLTAFGQPTLAADPRQIQLGVRWNF